MCCDIWPGSGSPGDGERGMSEWGAAGEPGSCGPDLVAPSYATAIQSSSSKTAVHVKEGLTFKV